MGWKLLNSELLSFLWRGMTLAFLKASGKVSVEKIKLNISVRVYDNIFLNALRILVGMLFIPIALLSFKNLRWSSTSSAVVGVRQKVFSLGFYNDSWNWDSVLTILALIFVATELKKWLNSQPTLFFSVISVWFIFRQLRVNLGCELRLIISFIPCQVLKEFFLFSWKRFLKCDSLLLLVRFVMRFLLALCYIVCEVLLSFLNLLLDKTFYIGYFSF